MAKKKIKVGRFRVPAEMNPGVYRAGVGMFTRGQEFTLPDSASVPGDFISAKLIPLNPTAVKMLKDSEKRRVAQAKKAVAGVPEYDPTQLQEIKKIPTEDDPDTIEVDIDDEEGEGSSDVNDDELEALTRPGPAKGTREADKD